jgi:hypothetical protein
MVYHRIIFIIRSAAAYYDMTHPSRLGERTPDEIDFVWIKLSVEKRKKWIEEHSKKYEDYVLDMIKFAQVNSSVSFLCQILSNRISYL